MAEPSSVDRLVAESERLRGMITRTVGELRELCDALEQTLRDAGESPHDDASGEDRR